MLNLDLAPVEPLGAAPGSPNLRPETQAAAKPLLTFSCIVADPPWPMPETGQTTRGETDAKGVYTAKGGRKVDGTWWGRHRGGKVKLPYATMALSEIEGLPVSRLAEKDAHLYLWTTSRFVEAAYDVARKWGFRPAQLLTWCKTPMGIGFGGAYCNTTEFVLFCRRGTLKTLRRIDSTWWHWQRPYEGGHIAHSAKPEAFTDMVESVSPGPYLELFARRNRLGWSTWGNESFCHVDMDTGAVAPAADSENGGDMARLPAQRRSRKEG